MQQSDGNGRFRTGAEVVKAQGKT